MLEHTLIVWATEFGRMPFLQANGSGRDHNPGAFTCFMTGAGVKQGSVMVKVTSLDLKPPSTKPAFMILTQPYYI